ncbi:hypothetical protein ABBQ38_001617 [Trebouxia sp. C0009 RCD-2024]
MATVAVREADVQLSNNQKDFIVKALHEEIRIDGRRPLDYRKVSFQYTLDDSSCTVLLGQTRVLSVVTAALEAPYPDRPNEGSLRFNVEFSPMASPNFEPGRPTENANELARLIERGLRETKAVDLEALCVLAGRKVWSLRVDVHILDHCGNLADAASLSALAALLAFRRPEVTLEAGGGGVGEGQQVVVHPPDVREPLPLSIHHTPLAVTFASFKAGELMVVDPSLEEEATAAGLMTVIMNAFGELCAVQKTSGIGLPTSEVMRLVRIAERKVKELSEMLQASLKAHDVERVQARIRRHNLTPAVSQTQSRAVTVLNSSDIIGRGLAHQLKLDSGSDDSDLLSTSQSESSDEDMVSDEEGAGSLEGKAADVEMATTSGDVGDNMGSPHSSKPVEQSQASSATQYALPAKANWRQARPPKAVSVKQEQPEPDLQAGAAFLAGTASVHQSLEAAVRPQAQRNKRSKTK